MLWRVRTTLSDRPGALAVLARHCGEQCVNILALQIFPELGGVVDELVLRAPDGWRTGDVAALVEGAGGGRVSVAPVGENALVDAPVQHLHALRRVAADPASLPDALARLLDADDHVVAQGSPVTDLSPVQHTLDVDWREHRVTLRRTTPFTATEHARAAAFVAAVDDLVDADPVHDPEAAGPAPSYDEGRPRVRPARFADTAALVRMHERCSLDTVTQRYAAPLPRIDERFARRLLLAGGGAVVADVDGEVVGLASVSTCEAGAAEAGILVEDGWQRRGLGTRLLGAAARLARRDGATELVLRSRGHHPGLMSLAFASGLRARIRLDGDTVVVTVGVESLAPLPAVPSGQAP